MLSSWPDVGRGTAVADLGAEHDVRWTCAHHRRHDTASLPLWFIEVTTNTHFCCLNFELLFFIFFHSSSLFFFFFLVVVVEDAAPSRSTTLGYQFHSSLFSSWWHSARLLYARQEMSCWWMRARSSFDSPPALHEGVFFPALAHSLWKICLVLLDHRLPGTRVYYNSVCCFPRIAAAVGHPAS